MSCSRCSGDGGDGGDGGDDGGVYLRARKNLSVNKSRRLVNGGDGEGRGGEGDRGYARTHVAPRRGFERIRLIQSIRDGDGLTRIVVI